MIREMTIQIIGADQSLCENIAVILDTPHCNVVNKGSGADALEEASLTILCLSDESDIDSLFTGIEVLSSKLVVISKHYSSSLKQWAFQNRAMAYFHMPVSRYQILGQLEILCRKTDLSDLEDESIIAFLRAFKQSGSKSMKPEHDDAARLRHWYPLPDLHFINGCDQIALLEYCADLGLLHRTLHNRLRTCPTCSGSNINYREICPRCSSIDIHKEQVIHHFTCGHVAQLADYVDGKGLLCPKCGLNLKHIGADYEKPADYFMCSSCSFICPEPSTEFQCFTCDTKGKPEETREVNIYAYELSEAGDQAIASGKLGSIDLETILFNKYTGLYNKEYVIHELRRAVECYRRYKLPFTFMLIRVDAFDEVKINYPDKLQTYVNSIFSSVSDQLRLLDTICVWSSTTLGLVCGGTDANGAAILAKRMCSNTSELEFLYEFAEPSLTICLNECTDDITDYKQLIELTMLEFDNDENADN